MELTPGRFLTTWLTSVACALAAVGAYNAFMDPYALMGMHRISGVNARKPAIDTQQDLIKAYDVLRVAPRTLILGSSQVELGMDARYLAALAHNEPGYNLGVARGGIYEAYRYLQHAAARSDVKLIVLGIEYRDFLEDPGPRRTAFESRLTVRADGQPNTYASVQHAKDLLWGLFSWDAISDSVWTQAQNIARDSSDFSPGLWDYGDFHPGGRWVGNRPFFIGFDHMFARGYSHIRVDPVYMGYMADILTFTRRLGARIVVVLNPTHTDELEMLHLTGQWPAFEQWKRDLVSLVARYSEAGEPVELWDFCDYNRYTSEAMPAEGGRMQWFLNPVHYSPALGYLMLNRLFGQGDPTFGALLTPQTLESHLAAIRAQHTHYQEHNSIDEQRVLSAYYLARERPQAN